MSISYYLWCSCSRISFNYPRWVFPKIEIGAPRQHMATAHKAAIVALWERSQPLSGSRVKATRGDLNKLHVSVVNLVATGHYPLTTDRSTFGLTLRLLLDALVTIGG